MIKINLLLEKGYRELQLRMNMICTFVVNLPEWNTLIG
jgi:hypothetical protein